MGPDLSLLRKSLQESSISSLFLERSIDAVLVQLVDFLNPVRQNLDRKPGSGTGYEVYKRTPGLTTGTYDDAIDVIDTDSAEEKTGAYTELYLAYKTLLTRGQVGRRVQKTGKTIAELLQTEMEMKAIELKDAEELRIMFGQISGNTKQWPGLHTYMTASGLAGHSAGTNLVGLTYADPTLAGFDLLIDLNLGNAGMIVTSRTGRRKMNALLQAQQRFIEKVEINGGFRVMSYDNIPVVASTVIPDVLSVAAGGTISSLTGGSTTLYACLDLNDVFMSVLTEVTAMPLARTTSQYESFDMYMDETLVVRDTRHVSFMTGVKTR